MAACPFCDIVREDAQATIVWRDPERIAFLDSRPLFKGHVLVCPTAHLTTLAELPTALLAPLFGLVQRISGVLPTALEAQGTFVALNNVVSQSVPHLHVHVVPRRKGDGLKGFFWPRTRYADLDEREAYGAKIARALGEPVAL